MISHTQAGARPLTAGVPEERCPARPLLGGDTPLLSMVRRQGRAQHGCVRTGSCLQTGHSRAKTDSLYKTKEPSPAPRPAGAAQEVTEAWCPPEASTSRASVREQGCTLMENPSLVPLLTALWLPSLLGSCEGKWPGRRKDNGAPGAAVQEGPGPPTLQL